MITVSFIIQYLSSFISLRYTCLATCARYFVRALREGGAPARPQLPFRQFK